MKKNKGTDLFSIFYKNSLLVEAVVICLIFEIFTQGSFLKVSNFVNLLMQGATCSIIAITMCMIIITGNADLSAGRFLGMLSMVAAILQVNYSGLPSWLVLILVYVVAIAVGLWHGFWIGYLKLPAFIITLTSQLIFLGINQFISGGRIYGPVGGVIALMGSGYLPSFGQEMNVSTLIVGAVIIAAYLYLTVSRQRKEMQQGLAQEDSKMIGIKTAAICILVGVVTWLFAGHKGFSWAMVILFVMTMVVSYISKNTKFGRYIYAIGGNSSAAALSGVNVPKETLKLYVLHGVIVATAAMVYLGRLNSATTSAGNGYEFTAITGCVVGGTAITGGRGTVVGAVVGTMVMAALDNGMSLMNLDPSLQYVVRGAVLLFAIALDAYANNRKSKTVQQA